MIRISSIKKTLESKITPRSGGSTEMQENYYYKVYCQPTTLVATQCTTTSSSLSHAGLITATEQYCGALCLLKSYCTTNGTGTDITCTGDGTQVTFTCTV